MIAVTRIHFASTPPRATEWGRCPECVAWYKEHRADAILASWSLVSSHTMTEAQAIDLHMRERHEREHDPEASSGE